MIPVTLLLHGSELSCFMDDNSEFKVAREGRTAPAWLTHDVVIILERMSAERPELLLRAKAAGPEVLRALLEETTANMQRDFDAAVYDLPGGYDDMSNLLNGREQMNAVPLEQFVPKKYLNAETDENDPA